MKNTKCSGARSSANQGALQRLPLTERSAQLCLLFVGLVAGGLPALPAESLAPTYETTAAATSAASANTAEQGGLTEIVVTANKREENIDKVGLTITALSAQELSERKITSLDDVAGAVPGLILTTGVTNSPILTLRGVGFNESSLGVYPAVSLYMDQAPLPFPVMTSHSAFDLERIEVLKGPQGTLFGENSTGGAINYIAAKPTKSFEAGADVGYGTFGSTDTDFYVSGPITDTLGIRVSGTSHHMDDWQYSVTRNDTNGHQDYQAGRLLLDWKASDTVNVSLNVNGWVDRSQPQAEQLIAIRPQKPAYEPIQFPTITFVPNNARAADWTNEALDPALGVVNPVTGAVEPGTAKLNSFDPYADNTFLQLALREDVNLTDSLVLSSLTTYDRYTQDQSVDADGSAYLIQNLVDDDGEIHSLIQEIRVANAASSRYRWTAGANYEASDTREYQLDRYLGDQYDPGNLYINASGITNLQQMRNWAIFDSNEFSVTDKITLKAAARYTSTKDSANVCSSTIPGGNVNTLFNDLGALLGKVPFTPVGPSGCYTLNADYVPGFPFISTLKQDNVSWRGGVDYQVTPSTLLYADVSRGFKAGSYPSLAAALYTGLEPVTQEELTAYEGGLKAQFLDRRATLDAALFYYDYKDKQVRGKLADPIFGDLDALINIPKSRIYGAESQLTIRPVDELTLSAAVTYLNSRIIDYTGVNIVGTPNFNSAGSPLPFTPNWAGSFDVDYRVKTSRGTPFVGLTVAGQSNSYAAISARQIDYTAAPNSFQRAGIDCVFCIQGYATVDARMGYESADGKWKAWIWGKNILNQYYWTTVVPSYDSAAREAGMPSTFGVSFGIKFN